MASYIVNPTTGKSRQLLLLNELVNRFINPTTMRYPELREAMDHDADDLKAFAQVLQRELSAAADQLAVALSQNNVDPVADIKHKLKTSLQLLDAHDLRDDLASVVTDMRNGVALAPARKNATVEKLRQLVRELGRERW